MKLPSGLREFIESLNSHHVEYIIVGAYALTFHERPRYTGDIDLLVRASPENAARIESALADFSFVSLGLSADDFLASGQIIQLGQPPNRIDILTSIIGISFDEVWDNRVPSVLDGLPVSFIGKNLLVKNKKATGRSQGKADLEALDADEPACE